MGTTIRPELSDRNPYWLPKHRYYELKHFCLQYPLWKRACVKIIGSTKSLSIVENIPTSNLPGDPTGAMATLIGYYNEKIKMVENAAKESDIYLHDYILKAVTEDLSYTYLKTKLEMPCGRDMYYDRYRKFFWLLSAKRG